MGMGGTATLFVRNKVEIPAAATIRPIIDSLLARDGGGRFFILYLL
jgi:hypothetical protein